MHEIGKDPKGLIGKTTQGKAVRIWAISHNLCGELMTEVKGLRERERERERESKLDCTKHNEEHEGRMKWMLLAD